MHLTHKWSSGGSRHMGNLTQQPLYDLPLLHSYLKTISNAVPIMSINDWMNIKQFKDGYAACIFALGLLRNAYI